jgi:hypothetical protein
MMELAKSGVSDLVKSRFEDSLKTVGQSKIVKNPQVPELQELIDVILANKEITERASPPYANASAGKILFLSTVFPDDVFKYFSRLRAVFSDLTAT